MVLIDRQEHRAEYGIGGGIVWDSNSAEEYFEAILKARVLTEPPHRFSLLETMLWTPEEGFFLKDKHLDRLLDSADYFDFTCSRSEIEEKLYRLSSFFNQPQRVRLVLNRQGHVEMDSATILIEKKHIQVSLPEKPVDSNDIFLFHKTTHRDMYETARASRPDCEDVLLYNEHAELTEFTIGNLVVELDGELLTPPVDCGLLPGTFRAYLLETGKILERSVPLHRLKECTPLRGRAAIVPQMRSFLDDCGPTQHLLGNLLVDVDGESARSRIYVSDMHLGQGDEARRTFSTLGDYHDRWRRQ